MNGTLTVEPSLFEKESTALAGLDSIKNNALVIENSEFSGIGMKLTTMISGGPPPSQFLPSHS